MNETTGPPVLIPEGGLSVSPAVWQVFFIIIAPLLAGVAIALPLLIGAYVVSSVGLYIMQKINLTRSQFNFGPHLYNQDIIQDDQNDNN